MNAPSTTPENQFDQIQWPEKSPTQSQEQWEANKKVVDLLCQMGTVTEWIDDGTGIKIPYKYLVDGIEVQFLPNWAFYSVSGIKLSPPTSPDQVRDDTQAARYLISRGLIK